MVAARTVLEQLVNFETYLLNENIALNVTTPLLNADVISWPSRRDAGPFLESRDHHSFANYRKWVEDGAFSIMLFDGALLQITIGFDGERVATHRLAYVPCPVVDSDRILTDTDMALFFDYYEQSGLSEARLSTAIRFDFDPSQAGIGHPAAHLTFNSSSTRIACAGPISLAQFVTFIFKHFYPELSAVVHYFDSLPTTKHLRSTISPSEMTEMHLSWPMSA